ncbi:MAG: acyl-CoA dehydrogenase family protein [Chthoniobacter sp.]|uniref:acyl-CoA dehydrogenase family protein n=1 Tax=Chthoniobacter sp. TaxID=2510640 RepID=UPI0032A744DB
MRSFLTADQQARQRDFREFVALYVEPAAAEWDRAQSIPAATVTRMAEAGYLGNMLPVKYDGRGWDTVTFGLLNEAFGRGCPALTDLLTVQAMVSMTLLKWGTDEQKSRWLPPLARGEMIGAFALTEPSGGSHLKSLQTQFTECGDGSYRLNGQKTWISYAQTAGVFLVVGYVDSRPLACLLPRETPGLQVEPITGLLGFRAAGLGRVTFTDVAVPAASLVGKPGTALSYIAPIGLQYGRISTACSALGLVRGCFEEATSRAATRKIGPDTVGSFGMIHSMIAHMGTELEAAGLLCLAACRATDEREPDAFAKALMAKYFASRAAVAAANDAVQIWGGAGCHEDAPVSRYYRDAKIYEIIEGTSQIHEELLSRNFIEAGAKRAAQIR